MHDDLSALKVPRKIHKNRLTHLCITANQLLRRLYESPKIGKLLILCRHMKTLNTRYKWLEQIGILNLAFGHSS